MLTRKLFIAATYIVLTSVTLSAQVGIGTTTPDTTLHVRDSASSAQILLESDAAVAEMRIDGLTPRIEMYRQGVRKYRGEWASNQFKMYSSDPDTQIILGNPVLFYVPTLNLSSDRKVGINMGIGVPSETLHVNGRIKLGYSDVAATAGTMRWNNTTNQFEGYDGTEWSAFGAKMEDIDGDTGISFSEDSTDSVTVKANDGELSFDGHRLVLGKNGNTIVGHESTLTDTDDNTGNTVFGWLNGTNLLGGVSNTSAGFWTGHSLVDGDFNTMLGAFAGRFLKSGSSNTLLGYRAGYNTNGVGNVFIGNRAGEDELGSNKLYISNSETSSPLIYGDFTNGNLELNGATTIADDLTVTGVTETSDIFVSGDVEATDRVMANRVIVDAINPLVDFKSQGSTQYYMQYIESNDDFILHESGTGAVLKINDGDIYFPQLAGSGDLSLTIDNSGKLIAVAPPPAPTQFHYMDLEFHSYSSARVLFVRDLEDGVTLTSLSAEINNPGGLFNPLEVILYRYPKAGGASEEIFALDPPSGTSGTYSTNAIETAGANVIDLDNYLYYFVNPTTFGIYLTFTLSQ